MCVSLWLLLRLLLHLLDPGEVARPDEAPSAPDRCARMAAWISWPTGGDLLLGPASGECDPRRPGWRGRRTRGLAARDLAGLPPADLASAISRR
jgi:hypothetical protein